MQKQIEGRLLKRGARGGNGACIKYIFTIQISLIALISMEASTIKNTLLVFDKSKRMESCLTFDESGNSVSARRPDAPRA